VRQPDSGILRGAVDADELDWGEGHFYVFFRPMGRRWSGADHHAAVFSLCRMNRDKW
jgi:hypothetical protein